MTGEIADFIVGTRYENMPGETVAVAKSSIIDGIGVALAGSCEPGGKIVRAYAKEMGETGAATVIGDSFATSPILAAFANATCMHVLAFDDVATSWLGHPTAVVLPGILALAETTGASGKALLEAYLVGCEVAAKLGEVGAEHQQELPWHNTGSTGTIGAAAAAAKLLGCDRRQVLMALGIAASEAGGLKANFGSMTKPLHAGFAARNGVMAAALGQRGFTANDDIFERKGGYGATFLGDPRLGGRPLNLGRPFDILSPGRTVKPYACCRDIHGCIDAALTLRSEHAIVPEDVARVEYITGGAAGVAIHTIPRSGFEAKLSMQYCISVALLFGDVLLAHFKEEYVHDPALQSLMAKVTGVETKDIDPLESKVTITLRSGKEYSIVVPRPKGDPENQLGQSELIAKYRDCASRVMSSSRIERSLEVLAHLETLGDVRQLTGSLAPA